MWLELLVRCPGDRVEVVANIIIEAGSGGVVIEDPALIVECLEKGNTETIAPFLTPPAGEETVVKGYFLGDSNLSAKLEELSQRLSEQNVTWQTKEVQEEDWATAWRAYYKTVKLGRRLIVKPSWEDYTPDDGEVVIDMDPGMAFGCGTHETTSMCLNILEELVYGGETVFDIGTGSGILSIAAVLLGARRVIAVDMDEVAVRVAHENIVRNAVADRVEVLKGNLLENLMTDEKADLVVANIIADVIIGLAPVAAPVLKPGGRVVVSGIIRERVGEVIQVMEGHGLIYERGLEQGEWSAMVFRKE